MLSTRVSLRPMRRGECFTPSYHQHKDVVHFDYSERETFYWTRISWYNNYVNSGEWTEYVREGWLGTSYRRRAVVVVCVVCDILVVSRCVVIILGVSSINDRSRANHAQR
jgi:hypothetical protein